MVNMRAANAIIAREGNISDRAVRYLAARGDDNNDVNDHCVGDNKDGDDDFDRP